MQSYKLREDWLSNAVVLLIDMIFVLAGIQPEQWEGRKYRVSCGFPIGYRGSKTGKVTLGQAFDASISADGTMEIFINPLVDNPLEVLRILLHELVHVWCGIECGHRGQFAVIAKAIGFLGPMTQTPLSPDLKSKLEEIAEILGDYPHASIDANLRKKQGTRLLKLSCTSCGFTARVSGKWLSRITSASPCPACHSQSLVTD